MRMRRVPSVVSGYCLFHCLGVGGGGGVTAQIDSRKDHMRRGSVDLI